MKARVDRGLCTGTQNCVATAPDYFEVDNKGLSHVIKSPVEEKDEDLLMEAAESCPVDAVILENDDGEQTYP
jgi:ferredoxin